MYCSTETLENKKFKLCSFEIFPDLIFITNILPHLYAQHISRLQALLNNYPFAHPRCNFSKEDFSKNVRRAFRRLSSIDFNNYHKKLSSSLFECALISLKYPASSYLFKVNNRSIRKRCEKCS